MYILLSYNKNTNDKYEYCMYITRKCLILILIPQDSNLFQSQWRFHIYPYTWTCPSTHVCVLDFLIGIIIQTPIKMTAPST